jgi:PAS domain S-box-containing protein
MMTSASGSPGPLAAKLIRTADEWRSTFDAIDSPILLVDPAGRIARLNRSAQRLAGRPFDDLVGGTLATLGPRQPWTEAGRLVEEVRRYRVATSGQVRDEQGRSWELLASLALAETPTEERVIVSARDVSAVVHLEASLHRAEGVAAIGNLVAGIAHEVRNPLFAISAIVEAIAERVGSGAGLDAHVGTLRQEVDRLSRLMQELFDYGKAGVVELERCDLGKIVGVVAETYARAASEAQVTLHNGVPARMAELRLDPQRVRQALGNLVQNALQHSPPGSTVALDAWTSRSAVGAWVDVAVIDSGPGFHPPDLPSVFEPFFSRRRGGTGLGLSMVKRIAEAHGGHVKAENRPDGGALVVLSLALDAASGRPGQG